MFGESFNDENRRIIERWKKGARIAPSFGWQRMRRVIETNLNVRVVNKYWGQFKCIHCGKFKKKTKELDSLQKLAQETELSEEDVIRMTPYLKSFMTHVERLKSV